MAWREWFKNKRDRMRLLFLLYPEGYHVRCISKEELRAARRRRLIRLVYYLVISWFLFRSIYL